MKIILDTNAIKYQIKSKRYEYFDESYILPFQTKQLSPQQLKIYLDKGGSMLKFRIPLGVKGDENFFFLNPKQYLVLTHDKILKRQLKSRGYRTFIDPII